MKRIWNRLSSAVRWLLVTLLILVVVGGGAYAYVALTATGDVVVEEPLSFVGPNTFSVSLYPQESETVQLTVANASPVSIIIDLITTIVPDPGPKGLSISVPNNITIPGNGQTTIDIDIVAGKNAEPGTYSIQIDIDR